jgi:hypothetical protein
MQWNTAGGRRHLHFANRSEWIAQAGRHAPQARQFVVALECGDGPAGSDHPIHHCALEIDRLRRAVAHATGAIWTGLEGAALSALATLSENLFSM